MSGAYPKEIVQRAARARTEEVLRKRDHRDGSQAVRMPGLGLRETARKITSATVLRVRVLWWPEETLRPCPAVAGVDVKLSCVPFSSFTTGRRSERWRPSHTTAG